MIMPGARAVAVDDDRATERTITASLLRERGQALPTGSGLTGKAHKLAAFSGHGLADEHGR